MRTENLTFSVVASEAAWLDPLSPPRGGNRPDGIQMPHMTNKQLLTADKGRTLSFGMATGHSNPHRYNKISTLWTQDSLAQKKTTTSETWNVWSSYVWMFHTTNKNAYTTSVGRPQWRTSRPGSQWTDKMMFTRISSETQVDRIRLVRAQPDWGLRLRWWTLQKEGAVNQINITTNFLKSSRPYSAL